VVACTVQQCQGSSFRMHFPPGSHLCGTVGCHPALYHRMYSSEEPLCGDWLDALGPVHCGFGVLSAQCSCARLVSALSCLVRCPMHAREHNKAPHRRQGLDKDSQLIHCLQRRVGDRCCSRTFSC
jgi:hypothetical protein